ncbi:redoxin [Micromonospora craterilacus]|uniref:Redoxin n=1 Tax=Micromonospora craterilacus TaxID=1655439 RepID=A0A2W2FSV8_9ACTN|nr:redoxin domain-containing protein [Micromonospora craterilacus]PZG18124.1 redoxin [Micromonospora craterilacus]
MDRVGRTVAVVIAGVLAAAGCGTDVEPGTPADTTPPAATASTAAAPSPTSPTSPTPGAATAVPQTLAFTATTVDGQRFDAAELSGKPVVLWFWAAWCPRCRAAAEHVAGVQRDFGDRVQVVGVAGLGSGDEAMRRFVADQGIGGFVNLADDDGAVWKRFEVTTQEYYVVLDSAGAIVHKGALTAQALRDRAAALAG